MRVLVTGGAGYIGSTTAQLLAEYGHEVVVYDNLSTGYRDAVPQGILLIQADVSDRRELEAAFREYRTEAVLHFAASSDSAESVRVPEKYFQNNHAATLKLLEAMQAIGVGKIVFSSTASVYGEPEQIPISEDHPLNPETPYGKSKLLAERLLPSFDMEYVILRYFNASGGRERHNPETHLIPLVLRGARDGTPITVYGTDYDTPDGTCIRDYVHVADLAAAHVLALQATGKAACYNLGSGKGFSVREVIRAACEITGREIRAVEAQRRPGDSTILVAGSEKARTALGWSPKYELNDMILSAWECLNGNTLC